MVIRATPATTLPVLERIKARGSPPGVQPAAWLGAHARGRNLSSPSDTSVSRTRYTRLVRRITAYWSELGLII